MKHTAVAVVLALSIFVATPALTQTNDGYVGVFGDAAGTIRCMHAPPYVPTTLYVLAKTAGAISNGITGAEFRIQFANPGGYFLGYTAPESSIALGAPLDSTGFNISFRSCQVPAAGIVSLGTIMVFNAGSGGQTDIIVKRRNPPSNPTFAYALFTLCDAPVYTKSRMTFPPDSVSCLTQKPGLRVATSGTNDEFTTSLDGSGIEAAGRTYKGYLVSNCSGYERATCIIEHQSPTCGTQVEAWVNLTNKASSVWLEAGWLKLSTDTDVETFHEWRANDGTSEDPTQVAVPGSGGTTYRIRKDGDNVYVEAIGSSGGYAIPLVWNKFHSALDPLVGAEFSAELHGGTADHTPGSSSDPCDWSSAGVRKLGGNSDYAPGFPGTLMTPEAGNSSFGSTVTATAFSTYDTRP